MLIKFADESWRTVGIASTLAGDCGSPGAFNAYAMVKNAIPWVEETSGIDVTPCHDADGTWNPGPECGGFWTGLNEGNGSWSDWCAGTPSGGPSYTCGPDYTQSPEADAPIVTITTPGNGSEFMTDPDIGAAPITITAEANDGAGWGIKHVELLIDGQGIPGGVRSTPPYEWGANFPSGVFELQIRALDGWDNEGLSDVVTVYVDQDAPESTGSTGGSSGGETGGESSGDTGGGSSTGEPGGSGEEAGTGDDAGLDQASGGGCSVDSRRGGAPAGLLVLLGFLGLRRRD